MKHFSPRSQLILIAACAVAVFIAGLCAPKTEFLGDLRLLLLISLLLALSSTAIRAWVKREALPEAPEPDKPERILRIVAFFAHPLTLTALLAAVLAMQAFATHNRAMFNDEAIWNYVAHAWLRFGLPPYTGAVENKTPGIFYLFTASNLLTGVNYWFPRLLGILAGALTGYGIYAIGRRLAGRGTGLLALLIYGLTTASSVMDAPFTAQAETFMLAFSVPAVWLLVAARQTASPRAHLAAIFFAGCGIGAAVAFKQTALATMLGLFALYLSLKPLHARTAGAVARDCLVFASGVVLVTFASVLPLLLGGVSFSDYLHGAWLALGKSGSSVSSPLFRWNRAMHVLEAVDLQFYLLLGVVFLAVRRRLPAGVPVAGLVAWLLIELFAVNSSGTYWGHQLRQALPPLALLGGLTLRALLGGNFTREPLPRWPHRVLAAVSIAFIWLPPLGWQPLSDHARAARAAHTWVREHTAVNDFIYTFGVYNANQILARSGRRSSSRYFNQYFLNSPGVEAEIRRDLAARPPSCIVIEMHRSLSLTEELELPAWVDEMVAKSYILEKQITYAFKTRADDQGVDGFLIYRLNERELPADKSPPADNPAGSVALPARNMAMSRHK